MEVYVRGNLTRKDILKAFFKHLQPTRNSILIRMILLGFIILILFFMTDQGTATQTIYLLGVVVFIGVLSPWWMPFVQVLGFNRRSPLLKPLTGIVTDEGVHLIGDHFNSNMKWNSFSRYKKSKEVVLLYQGENAFNFLSRNLFQSSPDWEVCVKMVEKYLPDK
jgi:hypothetical protein